MHSLFLKIFIAIWASLVLLGVSLFLIERQLGGQELERSNQWLLAHADTAASLYQQEGIPAIQRWLRGLRQSENRHILLLDQEGQPLLRQRPMHGPAQGEASPRQWTGEPGIHHSRGGLYHITVSIPHTDPPLLLASRVDLGRLPNIGPAARLGLALLSSILLSLLLAYLLSRRLRLLRHTVQRMAQGDLQIRSNSRGSDEIAALGKDVDQMATRLQGILNNQQTLLRDVSHELRSPLARLRVALELAEQSGNLPQALARIGKEADTLEALVSDLLSLARLDANNVLLQRETVDLGQLLQTLINDASFEAEARQRRVTLNTVTTSVHLEGDAVLLRSALENVLRNAIRHTAENTTVEVVLGLQEGQIQIQICDHGEGVPETELQRIFDPFMRVGEARDRSGGGHGLGLTISARIVMAHRGQIQATNRVEGGLCVSIELPTHLAMD